MKSRNMEGYHNEGGHLKKINGQKYVFNESREGYFLTKSCAVLWFLAALAIMLIIFLLTYFLMAASCQSNNEVINANENVSIHYGSMISNGEGKRTEPLESELSSTTRTTTTIKTTPIIDEITVTPVETIISELSTAAIIDKNKTKKQIKPIDEEVEDIDDTFEDLEYTTANDEIVLAEGWNPSKYSLTIEPNFETSKSNGTMEIYMTNDLKYKDIQFIVLDIKDITITEPIVYEILSDDSLNKISFDSFYGDDYQTYVFVLNEEIRKQYADKEIKIMVNFNFISKLTDTLQGFYKTSYVDDLSGNVSTLASTQFSPIDARRAFPCFDRPDKKAYFEITLIREEEKAMSLANMPIQHKRQNRPGYVEEVFHVTPKMSTYLVAFIVSDLIKSNHTIIPDSDLPTINIWTRPEVSNMTNFAYTLSHKVLKYLNEYFGIKYELPKIDMVAVPDFGFSAMENYGLITFRESALLVPDNKLNGSSAEHTERVASIISHELAHQWFGNLVTMKWWDDLWLKEGFAVFMSYECLEEVHPNWRVLETFAITEMQKSMEIDSDKSSHAISFPVNTQSDIRRIFDPISYSKGASIIRMMRSFLGEQAFKAGLTEYLKKFKYSNANHDDLWKVMTENGHKYGTLPENLQIKNIMDTWTLQAGFPVITVNRSGSDLILSQHRYMIPNTDLNDQSKWFIPISYASQNDPNRSEVPSHWLSDKEETITIPGVMEDKKWLYVNINRTGYYRVKYDLDSYRSFSAEYVNLPKIFRATIIDDSLNLARVDLIGYDIPLTFLMRMQSVPNDYLAWTAAVKGIEYINYMVSREPAFEQFKAAMRYIGKLEFDQLTFDIKPDESHIELMHKSRIIKHACFYGHDRCTNKAQLIYRQWMTSPIVHQINPNLKDSIYCVALREGGTQEWYYALKRYRETTSASEKEIILNALGCTTKPWLLSKYLNMTISANSGIRKQDGARAFVSVAKNFIGYEIAFDFLVSNIKEISEYFGDGFSTLSKMIDSVTTYMNKDYQLEQFEKFAKKAGKLHLTPIKKSIELAKEQVKNNIAWRSKSYYQLQGYLDAFVRDLNINIY